MHFLPLSRWVASHPDDATQTTPSPAASVPPSDPVRGRHSLDSAAVRSSTSIETLSNRPACARASASKAVLSICSRKAWKDS